MSTELQTRKIPLIMKSSLVHWVSEETGAKIQQALSTQKSHTFITITELGITINTAEVDGVYTPDEYEALCNVKQGMWQCNFMKWHKKGGVCECKSEFYRKQNEERRRKENQVDDTPMSEEQRLKNLAKIAEIRKEFEDKGVFRKSQNTGYTLKRSALIEYKEKHGIAYVVPEGAEVVEDVDFISKK